MDYNATEPFHLATGSLDGEVRVWDIRKSSDSRYHLPNVHNGTVGALRWLSGERSRVISGGRRDGMLKTSDVLSGSYLQVAQTGSSVTGVAMSDNEIVTSHGVGGGNLQLRSLQTYEIMGTFSSPSNEPIMCIARSPNREHVCGAQRDETLKFWRVFEPTGRLGPKATLGKRNRDFEDDFR